MHNSERANLEFRITWDETNLWYLAGEPDSECRQRKIAAGLQSIEQARARLLELEQQRGP
jgi:hypothetical protein